MALSLAVLFIALGLGCWVYAEGKKVLHERAVQVELRGGLDASQTNFEMLSSMDSLVLRAMLIAVPGGLVGVGLLLVSVNRWRRGLVGQLEKKAKELSSANTIIQNQLADETRAKERLRLAQVELEERLAKAEEGATKLASNNAFLQEELNKRNRLDKALAQKRQELESSKNVLEIHVQARAQELQKLQRRYELILNSAGEGICGLDGDGRATFVNPAVARITGWAVEDLIGKTEAQIFGANGVNGHTDSRSACEQIFRRKDGTSFPVELVKTSINEDGRQVGSVLVFKDITERKRAEETLSQKAAELVRSNAELEQFAFVASHDLQEPLRKIQAFGDRVKTKCEGKQSTEVRDYLARMQSAAARMQTLINDLLAFSRVIRSSQPFVPVDLAGITRDVLGDLEVRIEQTRAKVELGNLPTVDADPLQMRQLMLNLISNALKFQPPGGTPVIKIEGKTVTAASGESYAEVTIQDNGIGFDEKYLDKIFAVFQRLHGRAEYEGTGVGLAVCRRITDRHGGNITAKSKPGQGAMFVITLPLHQPKTENK